MFTNDSFNNEKKFVISHELLALLNRIIDHEEKALTALVRRAVSSGLKDEITYNKRLSADELVEEARNTIIDFFAILEFNLVEAMHEQSVKKASEKNLLPAIEQLDATTFDQETVRQCLAKATNQSKDSKSTPKETLCKELLRSWNPQKNRVVN